MIRKTLLINIILMISLFFVTPVLAAKSYHAERFDVQIALQEDGAAIVTETVEFHFEGDPFTFAFREIDAKNTDGITFLDASLDGTAMSQGTQPGQVEVKAGNPLKVKWHFSPTANAAHTFVVRYRVDGLARKGEADTIIWRAIPEEHDYTIKQSSITLTYPSKAMPLGEPTLSRSFNAVVGDGPIRLTASDLGKDDDLVLTARFVSDSLTKTTPKWQVRKQQIDAAFSQASPGAVVAGLFALLLGGFGLVNFARANRREQIDSPVLPSPLPPADVPSALVGKLTGKSHSFMGAIFDLAQRGLLEVREEMGVLGTKKHMLIRKDANISLRPYEQGLLDAIFKTGETEVKLGDVPGRLMSKNALFDDPLEAELLQRGWRDPQRKEQRSKLISIGIIAMFVSIAILIAGIVVINMALGNAALITLIGVVSGISIGAFLLSMALLIYAAAYSTLTASGEEQAARWKGFEEYLKQASKGKEPAIRPDYFELYLAYAAVFGLGANWAKYFQTLGGVPLPVWFHASAASNADFSAIVVIMSASDSAGAGAAGGGGASASGGGSSGAG